MATSMMQKRIQSWQNSADEREAGRIEAFAAGALMAFVTCPMSIVAIAAPYWSGSQEANGMTMSFTLSLWTAATSIESAQGNADQTARMCGTEMQNSDIDCGSIHAIRFFQITGMLLALASAVVLLMAFSPLLKTRRELRPQLYLIGACLSGATGLWNLLSVCLAAGVKMPEQYSLCGAGFVFCILSMFLTVAALVLSVLARRSKSAPSIVVVQEVRKSDNAKTAPTLLVNVMPTAEKQATNLSKEAVDLENQISIVSADTAEEKADLAAKRTNETPLSLKAEPSFHNASSVTCVPGQLKVETPQSLKVETSFHNESSVTCVVPSQTKPAWVEEP
jgi:hypothetical protein